VPLKVHVGGIVEESVQKQLERSKVLKPSWIAGQPSHREESRKIPVSATFDIAYRWGLQPLERFAASLALSGKRPEPSNPNLFDLEAIDEYGCRIEDENEDLRFSHLLKIGYEGVYIPLDHEEFESKRALLPGVGSSRTLLGELESLGEYLPEKSGDERGGATTLGHRPYAVERSMCSILRWASRISVDLDLPIWFEHYYWKFPPNCPIGYREAGDLGFNTLVDCSISDQGNRLDVRVASGYLYSIPAAYLLSWYEPRQWKRSVRLIKAEVSPEADGLLVGFSDGSELNVGLVAILSGCEPYYEFFGGWTPEARSNVEKWQRDRGPFRVEPKLEGDPPTPSVPDSEADPEADS
jgi:hypothetical protein